MLLCFSGRALGKMRKAMSLLPSACESKCTCVHTHTMWIHIYTSSKCHLKKKHSMTQKSIAGTYPSHVRITCVDHFRQKHKYQ